MDNLYGILETVESLEDRRRIISHYISSHDISRLNNHNQGCFLTPDLKLPYHEQDDKRPETDTCLAFLVGKKYLVEENYHDAYLPVFVIGVVQTQRNKELLVANPDGSIQNLPRSYLESPDISALIKEFIPPRKFDLRQPYLFPPSPTFHKAWAA